MRFFDAAAWSGSWPFAFLEARTPRALATHLRGHGIARALVSQLDAVFAPSPGPSNRQLLRATRSERSLVPVPIINPALADWREELDRCAQDPRVKIVRVLPGYHALRVNSRAMHELARELLQRKLRLAVQVRLIDERHEWHGLNIKPVPTGALEELLTSNSSLPTLACGLGRLDLFALLPRHPKLLADLSFAEWHETLPYLADKVSHRQLAFSSHTPFHITAASMAKVKGQDVETAITAAVASGNLSSFLDL